MNWHHKLATLILGAALLVVPQTVPNAHAQAGAGGPRMIHVSSVAPDKNPQLATLIAEIRKQADAFVFLTAARRG